MRSAPPTPSVPVVTRFGTYTLIDRLAVGGMAEVFRALEPRPVGEPRVVVIKRMLPALASEPTAREMFEAERALGASIHHPNVVELLGSGERDGQPYLVLEYVRGVDLWRLARHLVLEGKTLSVAEALLITGELLAGLHAVHEAHDASGRAVGLVHRDVSPSNVLLSIHGDVKLGDFGIAHALRQQGKDAAAVRRAKGKLGYVSPEQVLGAPYDRRSDVFAAGVICAELLMGEPLFATGSELDILLAIRDARIQPFLDFASRLPAGLADVVAQALRREPGERTSTAEYFREKLAPFQTTPEAPLRRQLADLVSFALAVQDDQSPERLTPVYELPEEHARFRTPVGAPALAGEVRRSRPSMPTPIASVVPDASIPIEVEDPPVDEEPTIYVIRCKNGLSYGPWGYAKVVEAVTTGQVGPDDVLVEADKDPQPIRDVAELRRHLPASARRASIAPSPSGAPEPAPDEIVPLDGGGIVYALASAALYKTSGLWLCELGGVKKEVYVHEGVPEFVTSNLAGELLGEYLVARGVLSRGELDMALAMLPKFDGRFGETLAMLGLVQPMQLFKHIAEQVREKLLDLFLWNAGMATYFAGVPPPERGFPVGIDPWALLDEGIARRLAQGLEAERFAAREHDSLIAADPLPSEVSTAGFPGHVRLLLEILDRPRPLRDAIAIVDARGGAAGERAGHRAVVLLTQLGVVRWSTDLS